MDLAGLLPFSAHEQLIEMHFSKIAEVALLGFAKVSLDRLLRADRATFVAIAKKCRTGIRLAVGKRPIEEVLPDSLKAPTITLGLMPLHFSSVSANGKGSLASELSTVTTPLDGAQEEKKNNNNRSQKERQRDVIENLKQQLGGKDKKGKGNGKGKANQASRTRAPECQVRCRTSHTRQPRGNPFALASISPVVAPTPSQALSATVVGMCVQSQAAARTTLLPTMSDYQ